MRVVAGIYGGRKLHVPKNRDIRPTSDKIRGAVFNMLSSRNAVESAQVLDVFCGTGAMGIEALSRGAASCTFVDKSRDSLALTQKNVQMLEIGSRVQFKLMDATKASPKPTILPQAALIFIDPPYQKDMILPALDVLQSGHWLHPGAWIVCETERALTGSFPAVFFVDSEKTYGDTKITLLRYQPMTPE